MSMKIIKFIMGFVVGGVVAFVLSYAFGIAMEEMNISLYDSESDQQRNFNIFILFSLISAIFCGYLFIRVGRKSIK